MCGTVEVLLAEPVAGLDSFGVDRTSRVPDPADDVTAVNHGLAAETEIDEARDAYVAVVAG